MKYYIITFSLFLLPFVSLSQLDCNEVNCTKYTTAINKGNAALKDNDLKAALLQFLSAEIASRECDCIAADIKDKIQKAIEGLEKQKKDAIDNAKKAQEAEAIARSETEKVIAEQQKATLLKKTIEGIDTINSAYQFLYDEGIKFFDIKGDYKNAIVYFANARFLNQNDRVNTMIVLSQIGLEANKAFYMGQLQKATALYTQLFNPFTDSIYAKRQIDEAEHATSVFYNAINNRSFDNITVLKLYDNNLSILPHEIGQLTNLRKLELYDNELTTLPPEIGQLKNLTSLYLSENNLSTLPPEIGQLKNLTELNLRGNNLATLLPEIGQLKNLTSLILKENNLTTLPPEIGQLTNLRKLELYDNTLSSLPPEIGQLNNLTSLILWENNLTTLPPEIGQLNNLTSLNLGRNNLTTLPPEIGQLNNLTSLILWKNTLSSLPPEIGQLNNLTSLNLEDNNLSTLPPEIGQLNNLTSLDLSRNKLSTLPPEIGQLNNLKSLDLTDNNFSKAETKKNKKIIRKVKYRLSKTVWFMSIFQ